MRKNNWIKSKRSNGAVAKTLPARKSTPSKNRKAGRKTASNGFADPKTLLKNSTWTDDLERFPDLARQFDHGVESDERLSAGRTFADDAGPGGVVEFGECVGLSSHERFLDDDYGFFFLLILRGLGTSSNHLDLISSMISK